jgi:hypothetical protein
MKIIEIEVKPNGQTTLATIGFQGEECKEATTKLKEALGVVKEETPTSEMFISNAQGEKQVTLGS